MDIKRWVIACVYVLMSVMLMVLALILLYVGQEVFAQNLLVFLGIYMLVIPIGYVIYQRA